MKRILFGIAVITGLTFLVPQSVQAGWRRRPVVVHRYYAPPVQHYVYRPAYVAPTYWYHTGVYVQPPPIVVGGW
jgi:hypothetical protein